MSADSERRPSRGPRRFLVNDEGNSALHHFDLDAPHENWLYQGPGRDLQIIGDNRLLRSCAAGFVELDLAARGAVVREVRVPDAPGAIESARRLPNGNTVVAGNGGGGIFVWEIDAGNQPIAGRTQLFLGIDKVRMLRLTAEGTFLFCSNTNGKRIIHEMTWNNDLRTLFDVPGATPADSMVKAVRVSSNIVTVSTGYAASLIHIDTSSSQVLQTIGGKFQPEPTAIDATRALCPFFFSGYQMFDNGDCLVANWQGHSAERNHQGYQLLQYDRTGRLVWVFDQAKYPQTSSLNNVLVLDGLDTRRLHDEPNGVLIPVAPAT